MNLNTIAKANVPVMLGMHDVYGGGVMYWVSLSQKIYFKLCSKKTSAISAPFSISKFSTKLDM